MNALIRGWGAGQHEGIHTLSYHDNYYYYYYYYYYYCGTHLFPLSPAVPDMASVDQKASVGWAASTRPVWRGTMVSATMAAAEVDKRSGGRGWPVVMVVVVPWAGMELCWIHASTSFTTASSASADASTTTGSTSKSSFRKEGRKGVARTCEQ